MKPFQRGFTLVEAVIVIAITGAIAAVVAIFIQKPIQGYFDSARRAELTDIADTAVRRIGRDLHLALPNSVRIITVGTVTYLEFLQTSGGGRYRAAVDNTGAGNLLDFAQATSTFDVLGPPVVMVAGEQNLMVVFNQGPGTGADAYNADNSSPISAITGNQVTIASKLFPLASPASRFQIISYPVTYVCDPNAQTLTRVSNYKISTVQPTSFTGGTSALIAKNVSSCSFSYTAQVETQHAGVVATALQLTQSGESVNLYHEVHVSNVP